MTRKPDELGEDGKPKTWKERMEEIIAKSKKEKVTCTFTFDGLRSCKMFKRSYRQRIVSLFNFSLRENRKKNRIKN